MASTVPGDQAVPTTSGTARALGFEQLRRRLGRYIADEDLLHLALVHRSYCAEVQGEESNERLEFLGDAVLGVIVTAHLYLAHPTLSEGDLARIRSAIVSSDALAPVGAELGIGEALFLGRGESNSGGRRKSSLLANAFEALVGASYLAGGLASADALVSDVLSELIETAARQAVLGDAKNHLQELAAKAGLGLPSYDVIDDGPDHAKRFHATVQLAGVTGRGEGRSKKHAERAAAQEVIEALEDQPAGPPQMPLA